MFRGRYRWQIDKFVSIVHMKPFCSCPIISETVYAVRQPFWIEVLGSKRKRRKLLQAWTKLSLNWFLFHKLNIYTFPCRKWSQKFLRVCDILSLKHGGQGAERGRKKNKLLNVSPIKIRYILIGMEIEMERYRQNEKRFSSLQQEQRRRWRHTICCDILSNGHR